MTRPLIRLLDALTAALAWLLPAPPPLLRPVPVRVARARPIRRP